MRMRREACDNGLTQLAKVVREGDHFVALYSGVDEQHASPALHDNGIALDELALVDQHALRDLLHHGGPPVCGTARCSTVRSIEYRTHGSAMTSLAARAIKAPTAV